MESACPPVRAAPARRTGGARIGQNVGTCRYLAFLLNPPAVTDNAFSRLPLPPVLLDNLSTLGFTAMTPIQAESLPHILAGRDVMAQAKTGSGKTAAFGLGLLAGLDARNFDPQGLVLCPTRELADQVAAELRRLARASGNIKIVSLCGGTPLRPQAESLAHGAHIVVGTPGRLADHLSRGSLELGALRMLVLDEADRMLDMGFGEQIEIIASHCPTPRQTLLFSATYAGPARGIGLRFLNRPIEVKVEALHDDSRIEQIFFEIPREARYDSVLKLLAHYRPESTLAFCNTRAACDELALFLDQAGYSALPLHGELEQRDRDEILVQFANQSCAILVATDVAARGLDITGLDTVINVDVTKDTEVHVHRIGRTGRGDKPGLALNLCAPNEMRWATLVEKMLGTPLKWADIGALAPKGGGPMRAPRVTLCIQGGKKQKLRPGDLLGALTGDAGLSKEQVGKISVGENVSYVALDRQVAEQARARLAAGSIKGKAFRMRLMDARSILQGSR